MSKKPGIYYLLASGFIVFSLVAYYFIKVHYKSKDAFTMQAMSFADLPNWQFDNFNEMWPAFVSSCKKINLLPKDTILLNGSSLADWQRVCSLSEALDLTKNLDIKNFFEMNFTPFLVASANGVEGTFTGYYVPELHGSRIKKHPHTSPVYKRPNDLVMVEDLGIFNPKLKGIRIAGKVIKGSLQPYYTHAEISNGALDGNELIWLEDPIDAFFMQIQGSGLVKLESGETIRLAYDGTNGHLYTSIGKILIERQELTASEVSMQSIRAWLNTHPQQATELLQKNASFVFFAESSNISPIGAQGSVLSAGRSLAIDPVYIAYGTPIWIDIEHHNSEQRIQRLVVAQDKGGAIKGPIRGDLFCGIGDKAGDLAGKMKSKGCYYVLLPKKQ